MVRAHNTCAAVPTLFRREFAARTNMGKVPYVSLARQQHLNSRLSFLSNLSFP
jgi:hypothetical protein